MATNSKNSDIPILSFFTGLGLLDLGFHEAGFHSIWHNELMPDFVRGFEYGMESFGLTDAFSRIQNQRSIIEVAPNQILREAFGPLGKPEILGIIGGPPCPDFSVGGKNKGHEGDRGRLSQVFVSRILEINPTFFLFENVPGLIRTAKHRAFLRELLTQLSRHYQLDMRVVNALEYGVPQDRERLIIVGLQTKWLRANDRTISKQSADMLIRQARDTNVDDTTTRHWMPWNKFRTHPGAKGLYNWPDISPFGSVPSCPSGLPKELLVGPLICDQERLSFLPNSDECFAPYSDRFKTVWEGDVSKKCFKRLHRWRYSPAAAYGNNEVHLHPIEARRLTVREAMQIQTVPETFALPRDMTLSSKFKTIGNAVPVRLAKAMADSVQEVITAIINGNKYADI